MSRGFVTARLHEFGAVQCGRVYRISPERLSAYLDRNRVPSSPMRLVPNPNSVIDRAVRAARRSA